MILDDAPTVVISRSMERNAPVEHDVLPVFASLGRMPVWSPKPPQPFTLYGYKKRKRLARDCSRVLSNEGFK